MEISYSNGAGLPQDDGNFRDYLPLTTKNIPHISQNIVIYPRTTLAEHAQGYVSVISKIRTELETLQTQISANTALTGVADSMTTLINKSFSDLHSMDKKFTSLKGIFSDTNSSPTKIADTAKTMDNMSGLPEHISRHDFFENPRTTVKTFSPTEGLARIVLDLDELLRDFNQGRT
jgi:hypothetical protein